ncbi:hypothetical protein CHARACLAT_014967 [Characodon lateralis]|uniref:Uncharacterized protein n=1 Tax=Characodon lateralis TaxID=208331 RepID=A0ABU7CZP5_9TELE|nr:hypothetical protein [Characodon lateralis]
MVWLGSEPWRSSSAQQKIPALKEKRNPSGSKGILCKFNKWINPKTAGSLNLDTPELPLVATVVKLTSVQIKP